MRCFNELRRTLISGIDTDIVPGADVRLAELKQWISGIDAVSGSDLQPASNDASFRRYFRLRKRGISFIAMDAPPSQEDCLPFMRIAGFLEAMRLNAPRIIEADVENGFLLLTDLGTEQYCDVLQTSADLQSDLYRDAIDAILVMQRRGTAYQSVLPPYDEKLLRFELSLFREWLCGTHLQLPFSGADDDGWDCCCDVLVTNALDQPQVFVHRDYHSRNLMVTGNDNPGILDFQDAVEGPFTYDLVSLLKDCYVRWPVKQVRAWALQYYEKLSADTRKQVDERQFRRYFDLMGVQRHLKAAGIFCRLNHRDGKSSYLSDVPRAMSYIVELGQYYEELEYLVRLIEEQVLPSWSTR